MDEDHQCLMDDDLPDRQANDQDPTLQMSARGISPRGFTPCRLAGLGVLLLGTAAAAWLGLRHLSLTTRLRGTSNMVEKQERKEEIQEVRKPHPRNFCGHLEDGVELHTRTPLKRLEGVGSPEVCCAECDGNPRCGAWTWANSTGLNRQRHACLLMGHGKSGDVQRV